MEFNDVINNRYSVRKYADKQIEPEKLQAVLAAGNIAPTAKNNQPQRIYVLNSHEALDKIRGLTRCAFNAPVVLLLTYDENEQWNNPLEEGVVSGQQDVSIVATHMMLAAENEGLATCWVNYFPNTETEKAFDLPSTERAVLLMPIGYASEDSVPSVNHTTKKPLEMVVKYL